LASPRLTLAGDGFLGLDEDHFLLENAWLIPQYESHYCILQDVTDKVTKCGGG